LGGWKREFQRSIVFRAYQKGGKPLSGEGEEAFVGTQGCLAGSRVPVRKRRRSLKGQKYMVSKRRNETLKSGLGIEYLNT